MVRHRGLHKLEGADRLAELFAVVDIGTTTSMQVLHDADAAGGEHERS